VLITPLDLADVLLLQLDVYHDDRGAFQEVWNPTRMNLGGRNVQWIQDNTAFSHYRVLRGLHFQRPREQAKLVTVLTGSIFDVAVDVRPGSSTFGRWVSTVLEENSGHALYLPEGFAHGYQVLSPSAHVLYKCTDVYHPPSEHTVAWNDPDIAIEWPLTDPILSDKDRNAPSLASILRTPDGATAIR
jgi:dTDP-4-dehydrorhamnose 3,5-epimerase